MADQFINRTPKTPREWEIFCREIRRNLSDSDVTVSDLQVQFYALAASVQSKVSANDLNKLREEVEIQLAAIPKPEVTKADLDKLREEMQILAMSRG